MNRHDVLIVNDDPDMCQLLTAILDSSGYNTASAYNGSDALSQVAENKPDVVVLDTMMAEMDGWETCYHLRSRLGIPVIILSALVAGDIVSSDLPLKANDYVRKPFLPNEFLSRIETVLKVAENEQVHNSRYRPIIESRQPTVSVVIPTLNEVKNLSLVLPYLPLDTVDEVILVDGRSTDGTIEEAQRLLPAIKVIRETKLGKGAVLLAGYHAATGDIIVSLDADGSNDPRELPRFLEALTQGADFVKGSRFAPGGGTTDMPLYRKLGNAAFVSMANLLFNGTYTDLCYGYSAFWRYCLDVLEPIEANGFEIETMVYIRALRIRLRIVEVPSFEGYRFWGRGKLKTIPDGLRVLRTIFQEWVDSVQNNGLELYKGFRNEPPPFLRPSANAPTILSEPFDNAASRE